MAYVNGEWLDRKKRAARIDVLTERVRKLKVLYERGDATDGMVDTMLADIDELKRLKRVHRAEHDMLFFTYEYFSEERNPGNPSNLIPAGQRLEDAADFHRELCAMLDEVTRGEVDTNIAWSVGRRHAKTAYLSNSFLCHQLVFRHQKYIVEVSETTDVAGDFITWTRFQLKFNEKLRRDFGVLLEEKPSKNELDNKYEFITSTGAKVEAKGVGTQMRGLRHLSDRPGLFILDDLESNDNTNTKELRAKNLHWFRSEMLEALGFGGMAIYMGTIVHYDSLLNHVLTKRRDFKSRKFPAILEWSKREDLWQQWREIYNADDPQAKEKADAFYAEHEKEMIKGTRVLWPQMYTYKYFLEKREDIGARAFNQEYLGNPVDDETQIFKPEEFTYYSPRDIEDVKLDYYCGIDFAMGKERGDYSAIITVGRSPNGVFYVIDSYIKRVHPDVLIEEVVSKAMKYQYEKIAVESQAAQEFFADKLGDALQAAGYPAITRLKQIKQRSQARKELRIESLLPDIQNGGIRFNRSHSLLLEMFELYPNHNHDDGPDALHMAVSCAGRRKARATTGTKRFR